MTDEAVFRDPARIPAADPPEPALISRDLGTPTPANRRARTRLGPG